MLYGLFLADRTKLFTIVQLMSFLSNIYIHTQIVQILANTLGAIWEFGVPPCRQSILSFEFYYMNQLYLRMWNYYYNFQFCKFFIQWAVFYEYIIRFQYFSIWSVLRLLPLLWNLKLLKHLLVWLSNNICTTIQSIYDHIFINIQTVSSKAVVELRTIVWFTPKKVFYFGLGRYYLFWELLRNSFYIKILLI